MFAFSFKISKKKALVCFFAVAAVLGVSVFLPKYISTTASNTIDKNLSAANAQERIAFLSQYGWSVKSEPHEVAEVIIPQKFGDVYSQYNEIQKNEGFDLSDYKGRRAKRWTYMVTNYPGYEDSDIIFANILVIDGKVIGGDICNIELNGFMHGFTRPDY